MNISKEKKGLSTRMKNKMMGFVGKKYDYFMHGKFYLWSVTIIGLMGETGYFLTEVTDGDKTWRSNASYGEVVNGIKKGLYVQQ